MAAALVLMLDMDVPRSKTEKQGEQAGSTGETDWHHANGANQRFSTHPFPIEAASTKNTNDGLIAAR
jgi:hypothetical protein